MSNLSVEPPPLSFPIYKYMTKFAAQRLVEENEIRLGTLYKFRGTEAYGPGIYDPLEGQHQTSTLGRTLSYTGETLPLSLRELAQIGPNGTIQFTNVTINTQTFDKYVFCASYQASDELIELMRGMDRPFCFEVTDPWRLTCLIAAAVRREHQISECVAYPFTKVNYVDKERAGLEDEPIDPTFIKSSIFAYQKEARTVISVGPEYTDRRTKTSKLQELLVTDPDMKSIFRGVRF